MSHCVCLPWPRPNKPGHRRYYIVPVWSSKLGNKDEFTRTPVMAGADQERKKELSMGTRQYDLVLQATAAK